MKLDYFESDLRVIIAYLETQLSRKDLSFGRKVRYGKRLIRAKKRLMEYILINE